MSRERWERPRTLLHAQRYEPMANVAKFHDAFGQNRYWDPPFSEEIAEQQRLLRARLILEEALEAVEALGFSVEVGTDLVPTLGYVYDDAAEEHLLKELADVLVVTYGTGDVMSVPVEDAYNEVMRSNMSKLGDDGKPIRREDGKILKGNRYWEADMHGVLNGDWL